MQAVEGNLSVHLFIDAQCPLDGLVVGSVQAKRPAILYEMANHRLQLAFHNGEHVRTRNKEVFEVRGGENEHFTRTVDTMEVVAVAGLCHFGPALKVRYLLFRFLRKEIVREANRQLAIAMQSVHHAIVVGIVLKSASGVDRAGDAETIELAEKEPRRI